MAIVNGAPPTQGAIRLAVGVILLRTTIRYFCVL
jgi:hypothetical protein